MKKGSVFIRQEIKTAICAAVMTLQICGAGAVTKNEIEADIMKAKTLQDQAHQIAEYVRSFDVSDSNPAIQFAKEKWEEQNTILTELYKQYEELEEEEKKTEAIKAMIKGYTEFQQNGTYLGEFRISHYCPCFYCNGNNSLTALGNPLMPWFTAAVDPSVIPLGSKLSIEGYGTFHAQDTGGAIKGNRIDICVGSHEEAMNLGVIYKDVYIP